MKYATRLTNGVRLAVLAFGIVATWGAAAQQHSSEPHHTVVSGDAIKWGPAPPSLPPGAQAAVLLGSPRRRARSCCA
jgi:hypothetical protein